MQFTRQFRYWDYILISLWNTIILYLIFRGKPIYGGDQGFIIYSHESFNYIFWGFIYPYTNYPYGYFPSYNPTNWTLLVTIPFTFFTFGEELFYNLLFIIGSVYVYKISRLYYQKSIAIISAILFPANWYILIGDIIVHDVFFNISIVYTLLPPITYYIIAYAKGKISSLKSFLIVSLLSFFVLSASGDLLPFVWLYILFLLIYFFYNRLVILLSYIISITLGQLYWIIFTAAPTVSEFTSIVNESYKSYVIVQQFYPFVYTMRAVGPDVGLPSYVYLLSFLIFLFLTVGIIKNRERDLRFFFLIWFIGTSFISSSYTPLKPLVVYGILHSGLFAPLRDPILFISPEIGVLYCILLPSAISSIRLDSLKYKALFLSFIILVSIVFPLPLISGGESSIVTIPNSFIKTVEYLNSVNGQFTVLLLPLTTPTWASTDWYMGNDIFIYFSSHPVLSGGFYAGGELNGLSTSLATSIYFFNESSTDLKNEITSIYNLLFILNIRYIVVETDMEAQALLLPLYLPAYKYVSSLCEISKVSGLVTLVRNYSPFYIFKVNIPVETYVFSLKQPLNLSENVSYQLIPLNFTWTSPASILVKSESQCLLLSFAYSPYWIANGNPGINYRNLTLFRVNSGGVVIYDTMYNNLMKSYEYALGYLVALILGVILINKFKIVKTKFKIWQSS
ncbi:MAG: hypothetical protein RXR43_03095 [Sulfolobus sp.]